MSFLIYDLTLLGIFIILLGIFLFRKRHNLKREGLLLLYKTSWGIKLIHRVGEKYKKTLKVLSYVSVTIGYLLMTGALYLVGRIVWIYVFNANVVRAIKIPPILPLIPYLPQVFKLSFLPPFYFTYWIIIIAVVAIFHEFAHGIFAARSKVKIKSTGFGFFPFFLPIFLAAFVEPDDEEMKKKKIFPQLAVLSAGTFANFVTAIISFGILVGFFALAFAPSGVAFNNYVNANVSVSSITSVGNHSLTNHSYQHIVDLMDNSGLNEIRTSEGNFLITKQSVLQQNNSKGLVMYFDAPAVKSNLEGIILNVNGEKVTSTKQLKEELDKHSPGETIILTVVSNESNPYNKSITLGQSPLNKSQPWLGIAFVNNKEGVLSKFYTPLSSFNIDHTTYARVYSSVYTSRIGDIGVFIYNLIWWLVIISISVAFVNMLPMGIFDGGRFFYLTVLAITKKEKTATIAYRLVTYLFLLVLAVVMFFWFLYIK